MNANSTFFLYVCQLKNLCVNTLSRKINIYFCRLFKEHFVPFQSLGINLLKIMGLFSNHFLCIGFVWVHAFN